MMNFFSCFGMLISIVWHFVQSDVNSCIGLCCSVFYQPIVLKMASFGSPLKLEPSSPKRRRPEIMWNKCICCQRPSLENLICMRNISKNSFIEAMNVWRDNIFERITGELSSVDGLLSPNVKVFYHRSCYKTYTSKHNCRPFTQLEENAWGYWINSRFSCHSDPIGGSTWFHW
jgi:hypothetical protein